MTCALVGCAYHPGSFNHFQVDFTGQRTTVGCLDVALERRPDLPTGGTVVAYSFGNRCDHPAPVDLLSVNVVGRTIDGREVDLVPFDPHQQIRPLSIDGRFAGKEAIAYPGPVPFAEICIDAASITHAQPAKWICLASSWPQPMPQTAQLERSAR